MAKTPQQKAMEAIERAATTAIKQRFKGATPRQREAIRSLASATNSERFGTIVWLAFHEATKTSVRQPPF